MSDPMNRDVFLVVDRFDDGLYVREAALHETFDEVVGFLEDANDPQAVYRINLWQCDCEDVSSRFAEAWWDELSGALDLADPDHPSPAIPSFINAHCPAATDDYLEMVTDRRVLGRTGLARLLGAPRRL